jgi:glycosyltransferase involved in cell wall biosynthesis
MKLAVVTTHPIQYYAPVFKLLAERRLIDVKVFYTLGRPGGQYDLGFAKKVNWDIPLLEGYNYEWIDNISAAPGSHHSKGIINPTLIQQISLYKPNAVLFIGWNYHSHLKAMRYFKNKVPVYFRGDSTLLDYNNPMKEIVKKIYLKWVYRNITVAFYVGINNKAYFKNYGFKNSQLTFAPHAIDNERFSVTRSSEASLLRQKFGIKKDDVLILFAGKFENKKAPLFLLNTFLSLNKSNVHLLFTGNGILQTQLKAERNKNVHFMDFQNQSFMPVVYQACDLFCLPSCGPGETWGLAVNEAMACNKAVLVSDKVGCAPDLVQNNYNGAIFKSGNKQSLLEKITELTKSKALLEEYGKRSGDIIQHWNFTKIAEAIETRILNEKN